MFSLLLFCVLISDADEHWQLCLISKSPSVSVWQMTYSGTEIYKKSTTLNETEDLEFEGNYHHVNAKHNEIQCTVS